MELLPCPMELLAALLLLQVTAANSFSHEIENFSLRQAIQKKSIQWIDSYQLNSLRPLQHTKRSWVITTIDVQEEDNGPFPKYAGQLFNNKSFNTSVKYVISGPGVDEPPEIGLFSIKDDANGHVCVHRTIDREKTPAFQIRFDMAYRKTGELVVRPLFFKIKVKDINDNAPEFPKEEYSITIRENPSKVSSILLCWFYVLGSKGKAIVPPQEGEQTLINCNEKSIMSLSQAKLDITGNAALPPMSVEPGKEVIAEDGLYASYETFQVRHLDCIIQTVDKILGQKLYNQNALEDYGAIYEPCRYAEEGELERSNSFCSVSTGSEELPVDFLNALGPKFSALEEICQKRFPSLN